MRRWIIALRCQESINYTDCEIEGLLLVIFLTVQRCDYSNNLLSNLIWNFPKALDVVTNYFVLFFKHPQIRSLAMFWSELPLSGDYGAHLRLNIFKVIGSYHLLNSFQVAFIHNLGGSFFLVLTAAFWNITSNFLSTTAFFFVQKVWEIVSAGISLSEPSSEALVACYLFWVIGRGERALVHTADERHWFYRWQSQSLVFEGAQRVLKWLVTLLLRFLTPVW